MIPEDNSGAVTRLEAFSDTDFAANMTVRKSMTGGIVMLNEMAVSGGARKQEGVFLSTMEVVHRGEIRQVGAGSRRIPHEGVKRDEAFDTARARAH